MTFRSNIKNYKIKFTPSAEKTLLKLDDQTAQKIQKKLIALVSGTENLNIKKMKGSSNPPQYRLKSGDYRIIYEIHHEIITILVIKVGHRREIYEK